MDQDAQFHRLIAAQRLESMGVLAGGIAHNLNNYLMVIAGALEVTLRHESLPATARENIEIATDAVRRAVQLQRQMLTYAGKLGGTRVPLDLNRVIADNMGLLKASVARSAGLEVEPGPDLPSIHGDANHVLQVVLILLSNASEAIGEKAGEIRIRTHAERVDTDTLLTGAVQPPPPPGDFVVLEVHDNGAGMATDAVDRVFDPFFSTKGPGRGMGMAALHGILRAYGGTVQIQSLADKGTTVRVFLPAHPTREAARPTAPMTQAPAAPSGNRRTTILLVDDEANVRMITTRMLEGLGYRVNSAANGVDGYQLFRRDPDAFAAVVMDVSMPQMDGLSALQEMRTAKPDVSVILISGHSVRNVAQDYLGLGACAFLEKPFSTDDLRAALRKAGLAS